MIALPTLNFSSTPCVPLRWEDVQALLWRGHRSCRGVVMAVLSDLGSLQHWFLVLMVIYCSGLTC